MFIPASPLPLSASRPASCQANIDIVLSVFFCGTDGDLRNAVTLLEHFYAWCDGAALDAHASECALAALDAEVGAHRSTAQFKLGFNGCVWMPGGVLAVCTH